jgi:hypothetical protein
MIDLNDDMRQALETAMADGLPVIVATSGAAGMPDPPGGVMVWDKDHLAWWGACPRHHLRNLQRTRRSPPVPQPGEAAGRGKFLAPSSCSPTAPVREGIMARTPQVSSIATPNGKASPCLFALIR